MIVGLLLGLLWIGTASRPDPCEFVGYRLAKHPSNCVSGFCKDLFLKTEENHITALHLNDPKDGFVSLSCLEAGAIVDSIVTSSVTLDMDFKPAVDRFLTILRTVIIPQLTGSLFLPEEFDVSFKAGIEEIDSILLGIYKKSLRDGVALRKFPESVEMSQLNRLWTDWVEWVCMHPFRFV